MNFSGDLTLENLRVLDIGTMVAGPVAATLMADFGAEVIKIEQPGVGDTLRGVGPYCDGESLWWNVDARNKKSITLDLRHPDGKEVFRKLVAKADVLIENFRPGTLAKWGLDYDSLKKINSKLIMLSVSGFGQTGPYSERAGYDRIALAYSGLYYLSGYEDRPPVKFGIPIADYTTAVMGAYSIMMALYHREATGGEGHQIDLALYETMFRLSEGIVTAYDKTGETRERTGNIHHAAAPGDVFLTNDGSYLIMTISEGKIFERFCMAIDRPDLIEKEEYKGLGSRRRHVDALNGLAAEWIGRHSFEEVDARFREHGLPYSLVYTTKDIFSDEHYTAKNNIVDVDHPRLGKLKMQGPVPNITGRKKTEITAAPALGEHNDTVYAELLGMSQEEIENMRARKII